MHLPGHLVHHNPVLCWSFISAKILVVLSRLLAARSPDLKHVVVGLGAIDDHSKCVGLFIVKAVIVLVIFRVI